MTPDDLNALKARWFDLIRQIAPHQQAMAALQAQANALEREIQAAEQAQA